MSTKLQAKRHNALRIQRARTNFQAPAVSCSSFICQEQVQENTIDEELSSKHSESEMIEVDDSYISNCSLPINNSTTDIAFESHESSAQLSAPQLSISKVELDTLSMQYFAVLSNGIRVPFDQAASPPFDDQTASLASKAESAGEVLQKVFEIYSQVAVEVAHSSELNVNGYLTAAELHQFEDIARVDSGYGSFLKGFNKGKTYEQLSKSEQRKASTMGSVLHAMKSSNQRDPHQIYLAQEIAAANGNVDATLRLTSKHGLTVGPTTLAKNICSAVSDGTYESPAMRNPYGSHFYEIGQDNLQWKFVDGKYFHVITLLLLQFSVEKCREREILNHHPLQVEMNHSSSSNLDEPNAQPLQNQSYLDALDTKSPLDDPEKLDTISKLTPMLTQEQSDRTQISLWCQAFFHVEDLALILLAQPSEFAEEINSGIPAAATAQKPSISRGLLDTLRAQCKNTISLAHPFF
jgi:hypothetical protein